MSSGTNEFDAYDDEELDFNDPDLISQLDSIPVPPSSVAPVATKSHTQVKRPPSTHARTILRPPQPPPSKKARHNPPAAAPKVVVPANPFAKKAARAVVPVVAVAKPVEAEVEEEMPLIMMGEEGGYVRAPEAAAKDPLAALKTWGAIGGREEKGKGREVVANGLGEEEREELEALRKEKAQLVESLQASQAKVEHAEHALVGKTGEITIVRVRLAKAAAANAAQLELDKTTKREYEEALEKREKEHRRAVEALMVEGAFKRQEMETSAVRRPTGSQWSSSSRARSNSLVGAGFGNMGPPPVPAYANSPSLGRAGRGSTSGIMAAGSSQRKAPPTFGGFQNSFETPSQPAARSRRSESATLQPIVGSIGRSKNGMVTPEAGGGKGKGKMLVDEVVEEDATGEVDVDAMEWNKDELEEEMDDEMDGSRESSDLRGDILSAIFNHTTFTPFDSESSTIAVLPTQRPSGSRPTPTRSTFDPTLTSNGLRASLNNPVEDSPSLPETTAIPTFHFLTNLRFPSGTPPATIAEYEEVTRDLFVTLGRRTLRYNSLGEDASDLASLVRGVGGGLEAMAYLLDNAGIVGPLSALLSLISSLVLLFPQFAGYYLNDHLLSRYHTSKLLGLLAKVIKRFGRPAPVVRVVEKSGKGKARDRSRRLRGVVLRPASKPTGVEEEERVELEPAKRSALMFAVVEVLEGLAWGLPERAEDQMEAFLKAPEAVATLLDPHQSTALLTGTTRFLLMLACHPNLFRLILGVKFYDASDVRAAKVPILDRIGTLLSIKTGSQSSILALEMCLLSLVTSLAMKNVDAIPLFASSTSLIPELLEKLFKDTRTVWEYDGQEVSDLTLASLASVVTRLSATINLFYFLTCAPTSPLNIADFFATSTFRGLADRYNVAFGMLAYASLPDWAEGSKDGARLVELGYLAQEIMEDVSPMEAEEIESCFATHAMDEADGEENGMGNETLGDEEEMAMRGGFSQGR